MFTKRGCHSRAVCHKSSQAQVDVVRDASPTARVVSIGRASKWTSVNIASLRERFLVSQKRCAVKQVSGNNKKSNYILMLGDV